MEEFGVFSHSNKDACAVECINRYPDCEAYYYNEGNQWGLNCRIFKPNPNAPFAFTKATIDLIYLLSSLYNKCYIVKPCTSRIANSEKYLVCKGFKLDNTYNLVNKLSQVLCQVNKENDIESFLKIKIPYLYFNKIEDINAILGQQQLENILSTLNLLDNCKNEKLDAIKKNNIQKCIQWCVKNKMPYHKNINCLNMFIPT